MKRIITIAGLMLMAAPAWAANCYICGTGSSDSCKNYCQYTGADTQKSRKRCADAGCKVSGTATCPTAVNYKICFVGELKKNTTQNVAQRR